MDVVFFESAALLWFQYGKNTHTNTHILGFQNVYRHPGLKGTAGAKKDTFWKKAHKANHIIIHMLSFHQSWGRIVGLIGLVISCLFICLCIHNFTPLAFRGPYPTAMEMIQRCVLRRCKSVREVSCKNIRPRFSSLLREGRTNGSSDRWTNVCTNVIGWAKGVSRDCFCILVGGELGGLCFASYRTFSSFGPLPKNCGKNLRGHIEEDDP